MEQRLQAPTQYTDQEDAPPCPKCEEVLIEPFIRQWSKDGKVVVECPNCHVWIAINEPNPRIIYDPTATIERSKQTIEQATDLLQELERGSEEGVNRESVEQSWALIEQALEALIEREQERIRKIESATEQGQ